MRAWSAPVWPLARAGLRRHVWSTVALALLVGLAGGVVTAAVAGARRTNTTMDRFLAFNRPEDLYAQSPDAATAEKVAALPQVADADRFPVVRLSASRDGADNGAVVPFGAADDHAFRTMNRPLVVAGRMIDLDQPFDVVVNEQAARRRSWRVGSSFSLYALSAEQIQQSEESGGNASSMPTGPTFTFRVVGIIRTPADVGPVLLNQDVLYEGQQVVLLTPAFLRTYAAALGAPLEVLPGMEGARIRLRRGLADLDAFTAAARPLLGPQGQIYAGSDFAKAGQNAKRGIRFQALALLAFAALAALASILVVGQALARQVALDAGDHPIMRALGLTGGQLRAAAAFRSLLVGAVGAALAVPVAVALSPLSPTGLARQAEIDPGVSVDVAVLVAGASATLALVLLRGTVAAWAATRRRDAGSGSLPAERPSRLADAVRRLGFPAPAVAGVRMSLEPGRGRTAFPVRTAALGAAGAVAGVVAALTFVTSLNGLVHNPRQQGWNWDALVGSPNTQGDQGPNMVARLRANPQVGAFAGFISLEDGRVNGVSAGAIAIDSLQGEVAPTILEGRTPRAGDEVALGSTTLAAVRRSVGDTVDVEGAGRTQAMRVVGRVVMPTALDLFGTSLGKGGIITADGARRFSSDPLGPENMIAVRYRVGSDPRVALASLQRDFPRLVLRYVPAGEIRNLQREASLPIVLAALLVILGGAAMAHALVTSIRRRRRDLAILKTLGFVRRQVTATVAWQASTLAVVALVVGLPLGVVVGRWSWALVVRQLGTQAEPVVPILVVVLAVPLAVGFANLLAAGPGWMAGRVRPAEALRAE